jgi:hypothetical protein
MKNIYVFGNEYLHEDRISREISNYLKCGIVHCRSPEDLLEANDGEVLILDVVKNIKDPVIITSSKQIKTRKMLSLHDFDLGFFLNLMERMGINRKIRIIGVPSEGNAQELAKKVEKMIEDG